MSMFSLPEELMPDVKMFEAMKGGAPVDLAGAMSLFAHPFAATAAASALGIGLASARFRLVAGHGLGNDRGVAARVCAAAMTKFAGDVRSFGRPNRARPPPGRSRRRRC